MLLSLRASEGDGESLQLKNVESKLEKEETAMLFYFSLVVGPPPFRYRIILPQEYYPNTKVEKLCGDFRVEIEF